MESLAFYGHHSLMANITGNHDIPRVISFASEALRFDEPDKEAGWTRDIQNINPVGYKKLASLTAFVMTIPGIPVIYYGDEIGMPGAGDPDNRRMMRFENLSELEQNQLDINKKLTQLRKERLSLIYGDFKVLKVSDKVYAYSRSYFDETTVVVFNKDSEASKIYLTVQDIDLSKATANFGATVSSKESALIIDLEANGFEVITF